MIVDTLSEHFHFGKCFNYRHPSPLRALIVTEDKKVGKSRMYKGAIFEREGEYVVFSMEN